MLAQVLGTLGWVGFLIGMASFSAGYYLTKWANEDTRQKMNPSLGGFYFFLFGFVIYISALFGVVLALR